MARETVYDFIVIGAGAAGEAAGHEARRLGASVLVVERELVGGSCPFWACMPSKALLHAAGIHHLGGDYSWRHASNFRDWITSREHRKVSDDSGHIKSLEKAGAKVAKGTAEITGPGAVRISSAGKTGAQRQGTQPDHRRGHALDRARPSGYRQDQAMDEPRGHVHSEPAQEPAGDGRRTDGR